jgi:hypothetical protein
MFRNFFVLLLSATSLFAAVKEVTHFKELASHVELDTMILLDIDETLITAAQMLGGDIWFESRIKKYQEEGDDFPIALERALNEWIAIMHLTRMELVEPEISTVLSQIQNKGISVMGITARGLALATRTVFQLREHQVDLAKTSPRQEDFCFPVQGHTVLYREGILFTSGRSKGEAFFQLCDKLGKTPKRVVAVDDKLSHLQSLEKEALKRGVEFIGLRYGFTDEKKAAFSPEIADYQLNHSTLTHLLSDNEAIEKMRGKAPSI